MEGISMNWKKLLIAWAVVFVLVFGLGFLIHAILLNADYAKVAELFRAEEETIFPAILVANLFFAFAFVLIYAHGVEEKPWLMQGLRYGLWVALLWAVPIFLIDYATQPLPVSLVAKQIIFESVDMLILGVATAALYRP